MGRGRKVLIGLLGLLAVLFIAAVAVFIIKPWAPEMVVTDPGQGGRRVTDGGMVANWYPSTRGGPQPAILVVGGSEGGLHRGVDRTAHALQEQGYSALALSFFGAEGQPEALEAVPLETFTDALDWMADQPEVDPERLGFMGTSKGGEAAVLLASRAPQLKAVVGYVPSNVVWAGVNAQEPWKMGSLGSSWSEGGEPLPYVPYKADNYRGGDLVKLYDDSLTALPDHQDAIIPVEKSKAPLLLICGEDDTMWPSCPMSQEVKKRADANGGPAVTVLAYPDAGHFISGPPLSGNGKPVDLASMGGTQAGGEAALADSWPKVLDFYRTALG